VQLVHFSASNLPCQRLQPYVGFVKIQPSLFLKSLHLMRTLATKSEQHISSRKEYDSLLHLHHIINFILTSPEILGFSLGNVWSDPGLAFEDRKKIVEQLAYFQSQLIFTSFPMIGSIFTNKETKQHYIGPLAPPVQIEAPRTRMGPWKAARDEMKSWIEDQLERLTSDPDAVLCRRREENAEDCSLSIIPAFHALYSGILTLIEQVRLIDRCDHSWCPFSLSHPDLTKNNVLVDYNDPTRVIALIDWEGARVGPWVSEGTSIVLC
jgi:Phosphotransferase enzyme family